VFSVALNQQGRRVNYFIASLINTTNTIIRNIVRPPATEIHIGDNTHHQDQSILSISFRVINTMVSKPTNPIPLDEDELDLLILSFLPIIKLFSNTSAG
jgi:hypothetical protein